MLASMDCMIAWIPIRDERSQKEFLAMQKGGAFCTGENPAKVRGRGQRSWGQAPNA